MIVVVTGSRDWRHPRFVHLVLNAAYVKWGAFILYHGACQYEDGRLRGADRYADEWARTVHGIEVRQRPADWDRYGNSAGPIRNRAMILEALSEAGSPDLVRVAAFPRGRSPGTRGMIRLAEDFKINYRAWEETDVPTWARAA